MTGDMSTEHPADDLGKPVRLPGGQTIESLERDAKAVNMHAMGYSYAEISDALAYGDRSAAHRAVKRAHERILKQPVMTHVAVELAKLDAYAMRFIAILHKRHLVVSGGKIVRDDQTGEPLGDDAPEMRALAELVKISESKRKLLGLDAAAKLDVNFGDSEVDEAIKDLVRAMESNGRAMEQRAARGEG